MPLTVALQSGTGEVLDRILDPEAALSRLLPTEGSSAYSFLSSIDRYGDTIFNRVQAPRFLKEWEDVQAKTESAYERELCLSIRNLFQKMHDGVHLYVRFIG